MAERTKLAIKAPEPQREHAPSQTRKPEPSQSMDSPIDRILHLQRTIGNQAVQRMMRSGILQAKLRIGQPNDIYEQEADRVADQVMRMPDIQRSPACSSCGEQKEGGPIQTKPLAGQITPLTQRQLEEEEEEPVQTKSLADQITPLVQRQAEEEEEPIQTKGFATQITPLVQRQVEPEEEEEEQAQLKPLANQSAPLVQRQVEPEEEEELIQTKKAGNVTPEVTPAINSSIQSLQSGGRPLSGSERSFFEPRFGADFSNVRVHNDTRAASVARSVNARAFTLGRDVVFGVGEYSSDTLSSRQLLAHELTHVVQQNGGPQHIQRATARIVECQKPGAQTCLVHLHRNERQALEVARRLFSQYCVNLVHIQTPPWTRLISVNVPASGGLSCRADPNRIFSEAGIRAQWNRWNRNLRCLSRRFRDRAIRAVVDYGNELRRITERCYGNVGTRGSGQQGPAVVALHNYRDRSGSVLQGFTAGGAYNTGGNRATALPDRSEDREKLLRIYRRLVDLPFPALPPLCPQRADVTPSLDCLRSINPYFAEGEEADFYLVTREEAFVELAQQRRNVVLQATNPSDDGSLSVLLGQQRYINLETWRTRGLGENVRQAEAALRHLSVLRGCPQSPAGCSVITPGSQASPSVPHAPTVQPSVSASSAAPEEIRRLPRTEKAISDNTLGIQTDLKNNLSIQRRILIGRRPEITEEERERGLEITDEERRERRHEMTDEERNSLHRPRTIVAYIIFRHRDLADRIIEDMEESNEDLYFRDLEELRREIATRIVTSTAMQATQVGPEIHAFAYPRRGRDNYYGPRVNIAAQDYWEPRVPDNYRVRRPSQAVHPHDPDVVRGREYRFTLTDPRGRRNAYQALMSLFEPQSHWRHRTLIHCDRLANLIHFRSFAVTLGSREFNQRVENGIIPLELSPTGFHGIVYSRVRRSGGPMTRVHLRRVSTGLSRADLLVGDHVVFHNHRHYDSLMEISGRTGVWRLEHTILIDRRGSNPEEDDIFLGHGSARRNERGMKRVLRTHFNNMVGYARARLLRDFSSLARRFRGRLTRSGRRFFFGRWPIQEVSENDIPGLYDPRTYPASQDLFPVHRPAESRRD